MTAFVPPLSTATAHQTELICPELRILGSPGIGFYISFPDCGTNLRTEICLYTKSARSGGAWGGRKRGAERRHRGGCTAVATIVRPQMEYL